MTIEETRELGFKKLDEGNFEEAVQLLESAAGGGDLESQFELGQMYWQLFEKNNDSTCYSKSIVYTKSAIENPDLSKFGIMKNDAEIRLGIAYCSGEGRQRRCDEGVALIERAVADVEKQGAMNKINPIIWYKLGHLYREGKTTADGRWESNTRYEREKVVKYFTLTSQNLPDGELKNAVQEMLDLAIKQLENQIDLEGNIEKVKRTQF